MTANPACCTPDTSLQDVARMMEQNDCGLIPVVESHSGMMPIGTITDRDIAIRAVAANQNPMNMKALDIMTSDVATVMPEMSIEECFDVMEDREIRRVVVVDSQGKCCGIVAQADVVQSDANPMRTNRVIRDISASAPSNNPGFMGMSGSSYRSMMSTSTLLPLLVGMGSGAALMYLLSNRENTRRGYAGNIDAYSPDRLDAANTENFGKYADAEEEVQKRQQDLEGRVQTVRSDLNSSDWAEDSQDRLGDSTMNNRGRSAGHNG